MTEIKQCRKTVFIITFTYLFFLYCLYCYITKSGFFDKTESIEYNNKLYSVIKDMPDKENAAKILHDIDISIDKLKKYIDSKFTNNYILEEERKFKGKGEILHRIKKRLNTYSKDSLKENYPRVRKTDVSYNLNKGSTIALCLRNYDEIRQFHDFNEILFVSIHELAHSLNCNEAAVMCGNSYGHDNTFWYIFRILLENAVEADIYKKKDYSDSPVNYCSMEITYSPLFDISLDDYRFKP